MMIAEHSPAVNEEARFVAVIQNKSTKVTKGGEMMAFATIEDMTGAMEALLFPKVYEESRQAFVVGNVVAVYGRISSREDEDPKLLCEKMCLVDDIIDSPESFVKAEEGRYTRRRQPRQSADGYAENAVPTERAAPAKAQADTGRKSNRPGLYVKVASKEGRMFERISSLLSVFEGDTPLYIYFVDTAKLVLAPQKHWVQPNDVLIKELKHQLGEKNVAIVE